MKTTFLFLLVAMTTFSQNLIVDSNMVLGQNCGQGQSQQVFEFQDINFNGDYILDLKNVNLIILGNQNGIGTIRNFCSNSVSQICISGNQNGSITYDGVTLVDCSTLSTPIFNENQNIELSFKIYDLSGRFLFGSVTHPYMYETLSRGIYLVVVDGFTPFKKAIN